MTATAVKPSPPEVRRRQLPVAIRRRRLLLRIANHAILIAVSAAFLFPIFFMLCTALMTDQQTLSDKIIPDPFVWSNFKTVFDQIDLARYTWNTFLYAGLSTVGVVPAMEKLAREPIMPNLAISLHSTTEDQRDELVPVNRKYGLRDLLDACRRFPLKRRDRITFEYVLLEEVNDTPEDARRLVRLLTGIKAKVNLLPLNEAAGIPFRRPSDKRVNTFARILAEHGVTVSVRKSRGRDIRAACGQLITESSRAKAPGQRLATLMAQAGS